MIRMQLGGGNQRHKENWSSNLLGTYQKEPAEKIYRKRVSQKRLGRKLGVSRMTMCRQLSKMNISCYKREKTPKYSEKQAEKANYLEK